jgi:hypothetical protein
MRRVPGVVTSIVSGLLVAGCSGSTSPTPPAPPTTTAAAPATATTPATASTSPSMPHGMQALFCPPQSAGGWLAVDPVTGQVSAAPVVEADCAASNVDLVFRYSRGFTYQAITAQSTDGITVGYVPSGQTNTNGLIDAGGKGAGTLFTFTPSGEAMPAPTFSSPGGDLIAVTTVGGFTEGPSTKMTSACVQEYYRTSGARGATLPAGAFCGGTAVTLPGCMTLIGFVSEKSVACLARTGSSGYPDTIRAYPLAGSSPMPILEPVTGSIYHADVSPDGKYVLYTTSTTTSTALNVAPTDTPAHAAPTQLEQWTSGGASGAIIGWIRDDGQFVA